MARNKAWKSPLFFIPCQFDNIILVIFFVFHSVKAAASVVAYSFAVHGLDVARLHLLVKLKSTSRFQGIIKNANSLIINKSQSYIYHILIELSYRNVMKNIDNNKNILSEVLISCKTENIIIYA